MWLLFSFMKILIHGEPKQSDAVLGWYWYNTWPHVWNIWCDNEVYVMTAHSQTTSVSVTNYHPCVDLKINRNIFLACLLIWHRLYPVCIKNKTSCLCMVQISFQMSKSYVSFYILQQFFSVRCDEVNHWKQFLSQTNIMSDIGVVSYSYERLIQSNKDLL